MVDRYFSLFQIYSYSSREEEAGVFHLDSRAGGSRQRSIISPAAPLITLSRLSRSALISDQFVIMTPPRQTRPSVSRPRHKLTTPHSLRIICTTQKIRTVICLPCQHSTKKECSAQVLVPIFLVSVRFYNSTQIPKVGFRLGGLTLK